MRQSLLQRRLGISTGPIEPQGKQDTMQQTSCNSIGNHICSESSSYSGYNTHENNSNSDKSNLHGCISPAAVIDHMRKSGASEESIRTAYSSPALLDYNCQLMLLERQNLKRLAMARNISAPVSRDSRHCPLIQPLYHDECSQNNYISQPKLLDQEQKKRLALAREERDGVPEESLAPSLDEQSSQRETDCPAPSLQTEELKTGAGIWVNEKKRGIPNHLANPSPFNHHWPLVQDFQLDAQNDLPSSHDGIEHSSQIGPSHQLWLSGPHALQDHETQRRLVEQQKSPQNPASSNLALQDYQMQLMLLEQQNKKRHIMRIAEKVKAEEKLAAQREAIIQRHQENMKHWQSTEQQQAVRVVPYDINPHTPKHPPFPPRTTVQGGHAAQTHPLEGQISACGQSNQAPSNKVDQSALTLRQRPAAIHHFCSHIVGPQTSALSGERFFMDLPIRSSKKGFEPTELDPAMDDWSDVERPRKRACSEESEQFSEGSDLIELDLEC